jgi:hypothetical protein
LYRAPVGATGLGGTVYIGADARNGGAQAGFGF